MELEIDRNIHQFRDGSLGFQVNTDSGIPTNLSIRRLFIKS